MKLCLGTAQLGMPYGVTNVRGIIPENEFSQILDLARQEGVDTLDTAPLYGTSEEILGKLLPKTHRFKIITKTPHFNTVEILPNHLEKLKTSLQTSLGKLHQQSIYGILIHRAEDLLASKGDLLYEELRRCQKRGMIQKIGVSVYTDQELKILLSRFDFDLVQIPLNILDQRLIHSGMLDKLRSKKIEVYARSLFLQGLLLAPHPSLPESITPLKPFLARFNQAHRAQEISALEACLAFVDKLPIDYGVVGTASFEEFKSMIQAYQKMKKRAIKLDFASLACHESALVDPRFWNQPAKAFGSTL